MTRPHAKNLCVGFRYALFSEPASGWVTLFSPSPPAADAGMAPKKGKGKGKEKKAGAPWGQPRSPGVACRVVGPPLAHRAVLHVPPVWQRLARARPSSTMRGC